uniref:Uncharacterized protein n=1 Tax=Arundo donax TaxID=35708 RepID=A0A0A9F5G5_ARUDO
MVNPVVSARCPRPLALTSCCCSSVRTHSFSFRVCWLGSRTPYRVQICELPTVLRPFAFCCCAIKP